MAERGGRCNKPGCPNASNPYHVCAEYCLRKTGETVKTAKDNKKGLDNHIRNKDGELKKMAGERKVHPTCNNASNPYHECADYCLKNADDRAKETRKGSGSFGRRKKKGSESHPASPQPNGGENFRVPAKKKLEDRNGVHSSSSQSPSKETSPRDPSFDEKPYQSSQVTSINGLVKPGHPEGQSKVSRKSAANGVHATPGEATLLSFLLSEDASGNKRSGSESNGSSAGLKATNTNNKDNAESVVSDSVSRVWVGKYHVKSSISSTLEAILEKHGDIAAGCQLESLALRAYYLECLCFVIQELQSTPLKHLTISKVKEMSAILKDVESAQINVIRLQDVLKQIKEALEVIGQQRIAEVNMVNYNQEVMKTTEEMKIQVEELERKEKEVAYMKAQVNETVARLNELKLRASQIEDTTASLISKTKDINYKALIDELL